MIYCKDHKTINMFEEFSCLGPRRKARIDSSWAKVFREKILPILPVENIFKEFSSGMGAPTKELYAMVGLMVLQQMNDLTDEEAVDQFAYNIQWHYALNITSEEDSATYVSPKTLWSMRTRITKLNMHQEIFNEVTKKLAEEYKADVSKQRIDSMHIFSNMRHLGRIGIFVKTIKKFLINLKRHHKEEYRTLDETIIERYMTKQGEAIFSMVKPTESRNTLENLAKDVYMLSEQFKSIQTVTSMTSYQLLVRLLKEQCVVEGVGKKTLKITAKDNKEIASDSMQNPSDPEAGYDGHKGKGYQVQLAENYNTDKECKTLSLITGVAVEPANKSDAEALVPMLESTEEIGLKPKEAIAEPVAKPTHFNKKSHLPEDKGCL